MSIEIAGLSSAQQFAAGMATAHTDAIAHTEIFRASVTTSGVTGDAVAAADRAAAAQSDAAAAWQRAHAALLAQDRVAEAYAAAPDAGSREFLTDTDSGASTPPTTLPTSAASVPETSMTQSGLPELPSSFRLTNSFERWAVDMALQTGDGTGENNAAAADCLIIKVKDASGEVAARLTHPEAVDTYRQLTEMLTTKSRSSRTIGSKLADGAQVEFRRLPKDEGIDLEVARWDEEADDFIGDVEVTMCLEDAQELHMRLTGALLAAGWLVLR